MGGNVLDQFSLAGKVALITGVNRGLGRALAIGLAHAGATIVGVSRLGADKTAWDSEALPRACYVIQADLAQTGACAEVVEAALSFVPRIDILVNNAGIIRRAPAEDYSDEDWQEVLRVNLDAPYQLSRQIGHLMLNQHSGKIINIASMLSFQGGKNVIAYTASKHAIAGMTRALANEWGARGIRVNAIAPGYMITDNTEPLRQDDRRREEITRRIPVGRWGTPEDVVGAGIFLASAASDYVNGQVLCVDGGWMSA